jgi:hypothetical protein
MPPNIELLDAVVLGDACAKDEAGWDDLGVDLQYKNRLLNDQY